MVGFDGNEWSVGYEVIEGFGMTDGGRFVPERAPIVC